MVYERRGVTTEDHSHIHKYEIDENGNGMTIDDNDHSHEIINYIVLPVSKSGHRHELSISNHLFFTKENKSKIEDLITTKLRKAKSQELDHSKIHHHTNKFGSYGEELPMKPNMNIPPYKMDDNGLDLMIQHFIKARNMAWSRSLHKHLNEQVADHIYKSYLLVKPRIIGQKFDRVDLSQERSTRTAQHNIRPTLDRYGQTEITPKQRDQRARYVYLERQHRKDLSIPYITQPRNDSSLFNSR